MNDDMDFSVNYEQLTQAAEQLLSRCKPTPNTPSDCELWHHLALRGVRDISGFRRINADRERFNDFLQIK